MWKGFHGPKAGATSFLACEAGRGCMATHAHLCSCIIFTHELTLRKRFFGLKVGATNRPEELDEAARRRMPKQLYIPLPCAEARRQMILHQLRDVRYDLPPPDLEKVVSKTD
ncbi:hypothetical protein DUNSADRAFT_6482, partial [Dunaliella salina]